LDRFGCRRRRQAIDIEMGRDSPHLEREVRVAPANHREVACISDFLDPSPVLGVLSIDFDCVKASITLAEGAVPERMGDDCSTVVIVSERHRLRRLERSRIRPGWRIRSHDEQMPSRCRYLDARETRPIHDRLRAKEIVVRDRESIEPSVASDSERQPRAEWIVLSRDIWSGMKEPAMRVQIAIEHARDRPSSSINTRSVHISRGNENRD
jgi:hypothetical protein